MLWKPLVVAVGLLLFGGMVSMAAESDAPDRPAAGKRRAQDQQAAPPRGAAADPVERKAQWRQRQAIGEAGAVRRAPEGRRVRPYARPARSMPAGSAGLIVRRMATFDTDGDGAVSRREFEAGAGRLFELLDANRDGKLESTERQGNLTGILLPPEVRTRRLMRLYDQSGDDRIAPDECLVPPKIFAEMDANNSGALEEDDLTSLSLLHAAILQDRTRRAAILVEHLDANNDGRLALEEFTISQAAFRKADHDGDGFLTGREMEDLPPLPPDHPRRRAERLIERFDRNGDAMLARDELRMPGWPFDDLDENRDGLVGAKEMAAWLDSDRATSVARGMPAIAPEKFFQFYDRNKDGRVTEEERRNLPERVWQRWDLNADGAIELEEMRKAGPGGGGERDAMGGDGRGRLFRDPPDVFIQDRDQDDDGKLTVEETGLGKRMFDRIDSDGDGKLTEDELSAAQERIRTRVPRRREEGGGPRINR